MQKDNKKLSCLYGSMQKNNKQLSSESREPRISEGGAEELNIRRNSLHNFREEDFNPLAFPRGSVRIHGEFRKYSVQSSDLKAFPGIEISAKGRVLWHSLNLNPTVV
jgi:hypothetical protein